MKRLLALTAFAIYVWGQTPATAQNPSNLAVLRVYNLTSANQYIDERPVNRQANYHSFCASGSGTWSVQMEHANSSAGSWTSFGPAAVVTNGSSSCVGIGIGYYPFIRLHTTVGSTTSTYTSWRDAYTSSPGTGGGGGGSITPTTNVLKGDNAGNAISAGFAATGAGIVSLFSGCSGIQYLGADAACHVPPGSGTVTQIGLVGTANQITVTGASPITGAGSWTLSFPLSGVTLPGTTTGTFSGNLTGNVSGTANTITGLLSLANTPLTTVGDLLFVGAGPVLARLGIGANNTCLTSNGTSPVWASCPSGGGATIESTTNVIKGDGAGNGISAGFAATGSGIASLFSGCSGIQYLGADGACHSPSGSGTVTSIGLSKTDDTNVTLTLGGTNPVTTAGTISLTAGWTGTLAAGRLNANVVQAVTNETNIHGAISAQNLTFSWAGTLAAARLNPNVVQSFVNDTNVTASITAQAATLGWTGTLAAGRLNANVVQAVTNDTNIHGAISAQNLTFSWAGTLAAARLNSNVVQAVTNDTNVTGSISAQNLTLGWTGTLAGSRMTTFAGDSGSGGVKGAVPAPAAGDAAAGKFLNANGSWVTPSGAGTVTVVGGGNLGATAIVTGGGSQQVQTPNTSATMDGSGNIATPGNITAGVGGSLAGFSDWGAGTAHTFTGVGFQSPTVVTTPFGMTLPGAPTTGFMLSTGTSSPAVVSFVSFTGTGNVARAISPTFTGTVTQPTFNSTNNCSSSASPAVCGSAAAGSFVIATSATTVTVNTSAVTANSQIMVQADTSLGTKLSVTCNADSTIANFIPVVTGRVAATSFTVTITGTVSTNPACYSYHITN